MKTISVVPDNIDFGSVEVGKSISETFTICNTGNASVVYNVMPLHNEFDIIDSGSGDILHAEHTWSSLLQKLKTTTMRALWRLHPMHQMVLSMYI